MLHWKFAWMHIRFMKHYLIASVLVFVFSFYMGAVYSNQFDTFIQEQLEVLKSITKQFEGKANPQFDLFWVIFLNNLRGALIAIAAGIFFGMFPLFFLVINGLLLGYVSVHAAAEKSWFYVFKVIAPHGVLELPAIFLASALGLKLGVLAIKMVITLPSPTRNAGVRQQFRHYFKGLISLTIYLIVGLFAAAIIESTLTLWLARL